MVAVEDGTRPLQLQVVGSAIVPRQRHHHVEIVELDAIFRALLVEGVEPPQLFLEQLGYGLRPVLVLGLFLKRGFCGGFRVVAKLLLDVLHLLVEEIFFLLLVEVNACLVANVALQFGKLYLAVLHLEQLKAALPHVAKLDESCLVFHWEGKVRTREIHQHGVVGDVHKRHYAVVGYVVVEAYELLSHRAHVVGYGIKLGVVGVGHALRKRHHMTFEIAAP